MDKVYEIEYINHRLSNLFMIPLGAAALFVADKLPIIENLLINMACNIIFVFLVCIIFSRISNFIFRKNGVVKLTNSELKVTLDIKEIIMAYMAPFGIGLLGNCITLIIKPKEGKSLSIISVRNFNKKRMEDHKYSKIFNHIKELNPTMDFEASITGNFFVLKNHSCK